jgi:hypothetical protein
MVEDGWRGNKIGWGVSFIHINVGNSTEQIYYQILRTVDVGCRCTYNTGLLMDTTYVSPYSPEGGVVEYPIYFCTTP